MAANYSGKDILTDDQIRARAPAVFTTEKPAHLSGRYTFQSTLEIITALRDRGWETTYAAQPATRTRQRFGADAQRHLVRMREAKSPTKVGDSAIEICIDHAHNGHRRLRMHLGLYRLVCMNGLMVSDHTFGGISFTHARSINDQTLDWVTAVHDATPTIAATQGEWVKHKLTNAGATAFAAHALKSLQNERLTPELVLAPRRKDDAPKTLWTAFNTVQENLIRGGIGEGNRRTRGIREVGRTITTNQTLWQAAHEFHQAA